MRYYSLLQNAVKSVLTCSMILINEKNNLNDKNKNHERRIDGYTSVH